MEFHAPFFRPNIERLKKRKDLKGLVCASYYGAEEKEQAFKALSELDSLETALFIAKVIRQRSVSEDAKLKLCEVLFKLSTSHCIAGLLAYANGGDYYHYSTDAVFRSVDGGLRKLIHLATLEQLKQYPLFYYKDVDKSNPEAVGVFINRILPSIKCDQPLINELEIKQLLELGWQPATPYYQALLFAYNHEWQKAAGLGEDAFFPLLAHIINIRSEGNREDQEAEKEIYPLILAMGMNIIPMLLNVCLNLDWQHTKYNQSAISIISDLLVDLAKQYPQTRDRIIQGLEKSLERGIEKHTLASTISRISSEIDVLLFISLGLEEAVRQAGENIILPLCQIDHSDLMKLSDERRSAIAKTLVEMGQTYPRYLKEIVQYLESRLEQSEIEEYKYVRKGLHQFEWATLSPQGRIFFDIYRHEWENCLKARGNSVKPLIKELIACGGDRDHQVVREIGEILNQLYAGGSLTRQEKLEIENIDGRVIIREFKPIAPMVTWDGWQDRPDDKAIEAMLESDSNAYSPGYVFTLNG